MYGGETKMGVSYTKLASIVAVAAVVGAVIFHQPVNAAPPATFTWTGAAGDHKMSTAGNWKEGAVPQQQVLSWYLSVFRRLMELFITI